MEQLLMKAGGGYQCTASFASEGATAIPTGRLGIKRGCD